MESILQPENMKNHFSFICQTLNYHQTLPLRFTDKGTMSMLFAELV